MSPMLNTFWRGEKAEQSHRERGGSVLPNYRDGYSVFSFAFPRCSRRRRKKKQNTRTQKNPSSAELSRRAAHTSAVLWRASSAVSTEPEEAVASLCSVLPKNTPPLRVMMLASGWVMTSVHFCTAQNQTFASEGFAICRHTTSENRIRKKKGRTLQESNGGGSLSRMDRCNRCNVTRRKHYRVTWTHSMNMKGCMNN